MTHQTWSQPEIAAFLLAHGADINTDWSTHEPASILHECAAQSNNETAQFLIDRGIDMIIEDHRSKPRRPSSASFGASGVL
jgi:ankyrin repeat protein